MNPFAATDRLRAWLDGVPSPCAETLPLARDSSARPLLYAVVRMAGETSPWALAWGPPDAPPRVRSVPDPRRADDVRAMVQPFAEALLTHFGHPAHQSAVDPARTLLLAPGASQLELLHLWAYRYARAVKVPERVRATMNAFGRLCGWLFRELDRPHQVTVLDLTRALREGWAIPAEDLRQQHLGFVLAWLTGTGGREARERRAVRAEQRAVGATMDPAVDRSLDGPVAAWNAARRDGRGDPASAAVIGETVEAEVLRRWCLGRDAWTVLQRDRRPTGEGFEALAQLARDEYARQWRAPEAERAEGRDPFVPDPETDHHGPAAASRFFAHQYADEVGAAALLRSDRGRVAQAVASGAALAGRVAVVRDEGSGRSTVPVWTVEATLEAPSRLREGAAVTVAGMPGRVGRVREITVRRGARFLTVELTQGKTGRAGLVHGASPALVGADVVLLPAGNQRLAEQKSYRVWSADVPGAWLTHGASPPPPEHTDGDRCDLVDLVEGLRGRAR